MKEALLWLEQAKSDLHAARDSIKSRHYDWACFQAQQASILQWVEKQL